MSARHARLRRVRPEWAADSDAAIDARVDLIVAFANDRMNPSRCAEYGQSFDRLRADIERDKREQVPT